MDLNRFIQVLNNPNEMSNNDTFIIEDIVNEFPFFQAARALHLKGLKNQNSFRYNEVLKTTAVYTADRSILFNFITSTDFENVTLKNNEAQLIAELESVDESIKENLGHSELNVTDEEVEKLNHLIESHDIKSHKEQELPVFNDLNDFPKTTNETIENEEIDLIKEYETEQHHISFDNLDEEVKDEKEMSFEEEIEKIANEFLKKIESEHKTFEPDPEFTLEDTTEIDEKWQINDINIGNKSEGAQELQQETSDASEKLDSSLDYDVEEKIKIENESNLIIETEKSKILDDNETIENEEIDLIKGYESEQHHFSFDNLDEEVKDEKEMSFEEEIEKIANEFLKKIESEHRTFEPDPEFKLEDTSVIDEKRQTNDFNIENENKETQELQKETIDASEKIDSFLNYDVEEKIKTEIEDITTTPFNSIENGSNLITENEKSKILGDQHLEAELISSFEKFESAASSEILNQDEDDIEKERREHFKKIENQFIEEISTTIRDDFDKKNQIKNEIIDYFTHLDKEVVLDDLLFEKMTHDLPEDLKQEIENEIILHFTQTSTPKETESSEKTENKPIIDPIEAEMIAHFSDLSSTVSEETKIEIPNAPIEDPIEKELREHFAKYNQKEEINELETPENLSVQEKTPQVITIENSEEAEEQEEIVFELLPNEIFSQTLSDEKTNVEEKIDLHLDEDFSPPIQFHRNDTHSFNNWLKLSTFKPINREVEPENTVSIVKKMEIIDEFIDKNPKIETLKNEVSISEVINQNIDNEEIMTETLARVYVMQHKYSDAMRAYQILSLKFPEKSSFFADQIKQIEIIRKNNLH